MTCDFLSIFVLFHDRLGSERPSDPAARGLLADPLPTSVSVRPSSPLRASAPPAAPSTLVKGPPSGAPDILAEILGALPDVEGPDGYVPDFAVESAAEKIWRSSEFR